MRWPWVTRRVHDLELDALRAQVAHADEVGRAAAVREQYWRERCERLTDAALARVGAIHEPTLVERKPTAADPFAMALSALGVKEIDSGKAPAG